MMVCFWKLNEDLSGVSEIWTSCHKITARSSGVAWKVPTLKELESLQARVINSLFSSAMPQRKLVMIQTEKVVQEAML